MLEQLTRNATIAISLIFLFCLWLFAWPKEMDRSAYKKSSVSTKETAKNIPINQNRLKVCKDIWFSEEDSQRLHYRIESASSSLILEPIGKKLVATEHLEQMRCWMQDKLLRNTSFESSQQTRYFTAREGTYHFLSQELIADNATLSLYRMPGHSLPDRGRLPTHEPFLSGQAQKIYLTVGGNSPAFEAHEFKASLSSPER